MNRNIARPRGLHLDVYRWETDSHPGFHPQGPQGLIDPTLKVDTCDILIGIFWRRFGTPVSDAKSGTEHEFHTAYEAWKKSRKPQIMVYFSQKPGSPKTKKETDQWGKVLRFKEKFPPEGLWWDYQDEAEFEHLTRNHLSQFLSLPAPDEDSDRSDDGKLTTTNWAAVDRKLLRKYLSMCAVHDRTFKKLIKSLPTDDSPVKHHFHDGGLSGPPSERATRLSQAGVLLCCDRNHMPHRDLHVHVKFQNRAHPDALTEELEGSVMLLYLELRKRLSELSQRTMGSASSRSASGAEAPLYDYPPNVIIEALVNFLIHRDYHSDDIGFITIYRDRLEFINPGKSLLPTEDLLAAESDIRPLYKRNPRLIEAMHKTRLNQKAGSGLISIKRELGQNGSRKPDGSPGFEIRNDEVNNRFVLTIFRRQTLDPRPLTTENGNRPSQFQLPPPPADFTGRAAELAELRAAIEKGGGHISGLQGQGGVGKTALALKLAAELAPNLPDAQIYLDLKGVSERPLTPAEAMSHVLHSFHPTAKLPEKEEDLRAQYLSVLHNKRALLLMDNAKDAAQVKPLIPPEGCALLVTSRQRFALPGLQARNLETLPPPDAKDLLLRIAPRIDGEAETIAKLCGYLPQALRLAASAIAVRVNLEPRDYTSQLADEKKRLELLAGDDESVTASISLSYNLLDAETQRRWRMLAVFPDTFDAPAAAAVWKIEGDATKEALSRILQHSMLEWNDDTKRYRLHELMRAFARERLTDAESDVAAVRHSTHYAGVLAAADELYLKGGGAVVRGLALLDLERGSIEAGQAWAAAHAGRDRDAAKLCSGYSNAGVYVLPLRQLPREQIRWHEAAPQAARQIDDRVAEGRHLGNLGLAYKRLGETRRAIEYYRKALTIFRKTGERRGEGTALDNLGFAYDSLGDYGRAIEYNEKALAIFREVGYRRGEGNALGNLGLANEALGEYHRAIDCHERSLAIAREIGDRKGEGQALGNLGNAYHSLGEYSRAIEYLEKCLDIARQIGDRRIEGNTLGNLGITYHSLGEHYRATEYHEQALVAALEIGDHQVEGNALYNTSLTLDELGDRKKAIEYAEAALKILEEIESPRVANVKKQLDVWRNG